jgi:ribosomal protein S18 acetylase RimI-like enzyme
MFSEAITKEQIEVPITLTGGVGVAIGNAVTSAIAAVTTGFSTDPVARWMYPDPADYLRWFPLFVNAFGGRAFENRTAFVTADASGAALWLPPGVEPDDAKIIKLVADTLDKDIQADFMALFEAMGDAHPTEPHWYLPMIGVETHKQGEGLGASLMRYALDRVDADGLPAYLESSNPRNISLYQRFGFELVGTIQIGAAPPLFPMLRQPV